MLDGVIVLRPRCHGMCELICRLDLRTSFGIIHVIELGVIHGVIDLRQVELLELGVIDGVILLRLRCHGLKRLILRLDLRTSFGVDLCLILGTAFWR